jgi:thiamine-monophosphate kinase
MTVRNPSHKPQAAVFDLTEAELVGRISRRLPPAPDWMVVGLGDDAAVIEAERNRLEVLSVDALVEGIHFDRRFTPFDAIGHRALAVNLSDLAAMGATPRLALLSLALPPDLALEQFDAMIDGLTRLAAQHRLHVAGGNLTRSPGLLVISVTVIGTVKRRQALVRSGARPGDELYVTGTLGAAAAGLQMLQASPPRGGAVRGLGDGVSGPASCTRRYLYPEARMRMGSLVGRNRAASACIDLSDGLADGVRQMAEASRVGAEIDADALPIEPAARDWFTARGLDAVHEALTRGDDYELLFAVRPRLRRRLEAARRHGDVALTRIGACTADGAIVIRSPGTTRPLPRGYTHFR